MVDTQSAAIISGSLSNSTKMGFFGEDELWLPWEFLNDHVGYHPWFFSMIGSVFVGLAGILPLYIIPIDEAAGLKNGGMLNTYYIINIIFLIAQYSQEYSKTNLYDNPIIGNRSNTCLIPNDLIHIRETSQLSIFLIIIINDDD